MSTFIFDLDGTLYREGVIIPGAVETINNLYKLGCKVLFSTNDATRTLAERTHMLQMLGFTVEPNGLMTAGYGTALYLRSLPISPRSILVLGTDALIQEIHAVCPDIALNQGAPFDTVIVSFDPLFSYDRLSDAQHAVLSGARLIATNRDPQYPGAQRIYPGAGALVAAVETACLTTSYTVGKPAPFLYDTLISLNAVDPQTTVIVGDSITTDIAAARPSGLYSVLVLSGITTEYPDQNDGTYPHLVIPSVQELIPALQNSRPDLLRQQIPIPATPKCDPAL